MMTNEHELITILDQGETLAVEFKSDARGLPDRDLVAAVVALANTEGGLILFGVEDDGAVTGAQPGHQDSTGLVALVVNRTKPSVAVSAEVVDWGNKKVLRILVPRSRNIISTSDGRLLRRRIMASGRPRIMPCRMPLQSC